MRKIIIIIALLVLSVGVYSCSLDKVDKTAISKVETPGHLLEVRTGMYSLARGAFMGDSFAQFDYMSDMLNETSQSGNRGHFSYNWELQSDSQDVGIIWYTAYRIIARANLLLSEVDGIIARYPKSEAELKIYKGEALLWRAVMHRYLALRFCVDYEPETAASKLGMPYMDKYEPASKNDRGTLQQTYDKMLEDAIAAEELLITNGASNAYFLTMDCVIAFKAQVYVDMHEYAKAITEIDKLIPKYALTTSRAALEKSLTADTSTETIFHVALNKSELSSSLWFMDYYGGYYEEESTNGDVLNAGYVPSENIVTLYDAADFRNGLYVNDAYLRIVYARRPGKFASKFRGNASLRTVADSKDYNAYNSAKIFRIADMVLLKAEAEYMGGTGTPAATLSTLLVSRGLPATTLSGAALFTEIQNERAREMFGEGNRIPDIKRWKLTVQRLPQLLLSGGTNKNLSGLGIHDMILKHDADKILMPIPLSEFPSNANLKGQQNPGYAE